MKRLLCAVAAIALIGSTAAVAQQYQRQETRTAQRTHTRTVERQKTRSVHRTETRARPNRSTHRANRVRTNRPTHRTTTRRVTRNVYRIGHRPSTYHRIHVSAFSYPRGYTYRHWRAGAVLPRLFLSRNYYWTDWAALGLLPPPPGYVWVRYGPDLLLVNVYTGRIADVIYGAFY